MNRSLLNPFEALKLPDNLESYLESDRGKATCMAFNHLGNVLAMGCSTGLIALWDFDTLSPDQEPALDVGNAAEPHDGTHAVSCIAFPAPRTGHTIMVAFSNPEATSAAGVVRVYETLTSRVLAEVSFDWTIQQFVAHPSRPDVIALLPANNLPLLVHLSPGRYHVPASVVGDPSRAGTRSFKFRQQSAPDGVPADDRGGSSEVTVSVLIAPGAPAPEATLRAGNARRRPEGYAVAFSTRGEHVLRGGSDGNIYVFSAFKSGSLGEAEVVKILKVPGGAAIRSLTWFRDKLLVNSWDRAMRLFNAEDIVGAKTEEAGPLAVKSVFTEAVSKLQGRCACFSQDGDFVLGGMAGNEHRIHVWRASDGHLETTLQGPTEGIVDLLWHPVQPVITSIGSATGGIYIWAKNFTENWSAFAPDFTELEANEEYEEAEDEFDAKDPDDDARIRAERERAEESVIVDVETCDPPTDLDMYEGELRRDGNDKIAIGFGNVEHPPFFRLPATPVPDSNFPYPMRQSLHSSKMGNGRHPPDIAPGAEQHSRGPSVGRDGVAVAGGDEKTRRSKPPRPSGKRSGAVPQGESAPKKTRQGS